MNKGDQMLDSSKTTFERQLQLELSQSEGNIEEDTAKRLHMARIKALEEARSQSSSSATKPNLLFKYFSAQNWKVISASGVACLMLVILVLPTLQTKQANTRNPANISGELFSNQEELEMLEDLEFYQWLADVEHG